jgi:anti-anti-sigma factor
VSEALAFQEQNAVLYLRAEGHVTAGLCADLRERGFSRLEDQPPVTAMYVDLSACDYMDSTFLGLLVGFNKRLLRQAKKPITIVRPTETARELLAGLGLSALVAITDDAVPFPAGMADIVKTKSPGADLLLRAHENLMEISEENRKRFAALHSVLKNQIGESEK